MSSPNATRPHMQSAAGAAAWNGASKPISGGWSLQLDVARLDDFGSALRFGRDATKPPRALPLRVGGSVPILAHAGSPLKRAQCATRCSCAPPLPLGCLSVPTAHTRWRPPALYPQRGRRAPKARLSVVTAPERWYPLQRNGRHHSDPWMNGQSPIRQRQVVVCFTAPNVRVPQAAMGGRRRVYAKTMSMPQTCRTMGSEATAAAIGVTATRRDPMAMLPFCGYNMADYFGHWLGIGRRVANPPRIFRVNWFRKGPDGKFLWPGFGDNLRVLKWVVDRVNGRGYAVESPIGWMPRHEDLDWSGLDFPASDFHELMAVGRDAGTAEANAHGDCSTASSTGCRRSSSSSANCCVAAVALTRPVGAGARAVTCAAGNRVGPSQPLQVDRAEMPARSSQLRSCCPRRHAKGSGLASFERRVSGSQIG
jgi:hypothetical protein